MHQFKKINDWYTTQDDISIEVAGNKSSLESYQDKQLNYALSKVKNFRTAIDAGAHIGLMSYRLSKKFQQVESFEFNPLVRNCLKQNMENKKCSNVNIYECGVGNTNASMDIRYKGKDPRRTFGTFVGTTSGDYPIKTIDSFNFTDVDFIKIDTEGYEPLVVQGALETIKRCRPIILYENKGHAKRFGFNYNTVSDMLRPLGYNILYKFSKDWVVGCDA